MGTGSVISARTLRDICLDPSGGNMCFNRESDPLLRGQAWMQYLFRFVTVRSEAVV